MALINFLLMKLFCFGLCFFLCMYCKGLHRPKNEVFFRKKVLEDFADEAIGLKMSHIFLFVKVEQKSFVTRTYMIGQNVTMTNDHQNCSSVSGKKGIDFGGRCYYSILNLLIVCLSLLQYTSSFENPFSTPVSRITWLKSHLLDCSAQVLEQEKILHADFNTRTIVIGVAKL